MLSTARAPFRHVTVPIDGSPASQRGIDYAIELAHEGVQVSFCSVVDSSMAALAGAGGAAVDPEPIVAAFEGAAAAICQQARARAAAAGVEADVRVLRGARVDAINACVHGNASDAVVIGTNARKGLERALLGSVAEGLLRCSDVPVVTVHADDVVRTGPIVVGIDRSSAAQAALDRALALAEATRERLCIVHVIDDATLPASSEFSGYDPHEARLAEQRDAGELLEEAADAARDRHVRFEIVELSGHPPRELLSFAKTFGASQIVIGTHGRSGLPRLILGSVAEELVRHAHLPVVVVRRP